MRPRVDIKRRLVCVFHKPLGCFEVYKMTQKGEVNKRIAPEFSFTDDIDEAFRNMTYPRAGFKSVNGMAVQNVKAKTWNEYVAKVWAEANK